MAAGLSLEYQKGERVIATAPSISVEDWRKAAVWAANNKLSHLPNIKEMDKTEPHEKNP